MPGQTASRRLCLLWISAMLCAACSGESSVPSGSQDKYSGSPRRGGTLKVVGDADVDHLSPTSAYVTGSMWLTRAYTRQLVTNPPSHDYETAISIVPDLATE